MSGLKGSVGGSTKAITGLESELRICFRDKTLQRRPSGLHGGLESDSEPGCAALDNVEELHGQGGSVSAVCGECSVTALGEEVLLGQGKLQSSGPSGALTTQKGEEGVSWAASGSSGFWGTHWTRRGGFSGTRLPGDRGLTVSSDSPQSGEGSWCGGAGRGWLQGRWPAEGGQSGEGGRGAGNAAAPALAQRGGGDLVRASFPGCWSVGGGLGV